MRGWEIGSSVVGLDNNGGEDGRLGAQISKVKKLPFIWIYTENGVQFTWKIPFI